MKDCKGSERKEKGRGTDLSDPFWVLSEEELEGVQLLGDSLDVVESVNSDNQLDTVEPLLELLDSLLHRRLPQTLRG